MENIHMYECPSCAAALRYDIGKQMLACDHCGNTLNPYAFQKVQDAEEHTDYEVTVFRCPQCGGELISDDTTAATFCSYCGSSTILDSRLSKERRPKSIIPFKQNTDQCKAAYHKMLKNAIFAPDDMKDPEHIDKFRGIYMPYWLYSYEYKGDLDLRGAVHETQGGEPVKNLYNVKLDVDVSYEDIAYDASSSFPDHISAAIGPFDNRDSKPFTPSFLSGFYADTSDVAGWVYETEAEKYFRLNCTNDLFENTTMGVYGVGNYYGCSVPASINPTSRKTELGLFPVWFLSYRNKDRIAYAVMNGQTGKMTGQLPVDIKKYLIISLLLSIPIFLLLCLLPTMMPAQLLTLSAFLAVFCGIVVNVQMSHAIAKDRSTDDKGEQYAASENPRPTDQMILFNHFVPQKNWNFGVIAVIVLFLTLLPISIFPIQSIRKILERPQILLFPAALIVIFGIICMVQKHLKKKQAYLPVTHTRDLWEGFGSDLLTKLPVLIKPLLALITSLVILIWNPIDDSWYYLGAVACMLGICFSLIDMMKQYNRLTTRKLPQLEKRGGDENA
ncbi:MAG: zinc ribbon domain-containing protein [Lachnospiraceae bacterium]|nr:zinc ribbon domain-containing protein [Lachnospiraceae bacterium]